MPHPERSVEMLLGSADGLGVFQSLDAHLGGRTVHAAIGGTR
jgi:phosphoribosylformylglycinamidine (FGAM) synthase-like amidotransferase family enzyme